MVGGFYNTKAGNIILRNYIFGLVSQLTLNSLNDPFTFWNKPLINLVYICPWVRAIIFSTEIEQKKKFWFSLGLCFEWGDINSGICHVVWEAEGEVCNRNAETGKYEMHRVRSSLWFQFYFIVPNFFQTEGQHMPSSILHELPLYSFNKHVSFTITSLGVVVIDN